MPFFQTTEGYYKYNVDEWILLEELDQFAPGPYSPYYSLPNDGLDIHNDTIYLKVDNEVHISKNFGESTEFFLSTTHLERIDSVLVSDKNLYVFGQKRIPHPNFGSVLVSSSDYELISKQDSQNSILVSKNIGLAHYFTRFQVSAEDSTAFALRTINRSDAGDNRIAFYDIETQDFSFDLKMDDSKVYVTYNGYKFGVFDLAHQEFIEYEINQQGTIHLDGNRIYIADRNKISDVTDYESGQIKTIIPNLKRTYCDALDYKISDSGNAYAATPGNLYQYDNLENSWTQLNLDFNDPIDFDIAPSGKIIAISPRYFYSFQSNGEAIDKIEFKEYIEKVPYYYTYIANTLSAYNDSICLLYTSPSPRDRG